MAAPAMDTNDSIGSPVPPKHETLPAREGLPPAPDMQLQILEQLRTLVLLQHQSVTKPPPIVTEFVWNTLLQVLGLAAAALFGAFSILAWQIGQAANELASGANDLASRSNNLGSDGVGLASRANCLEAASNWLSLVAYCQNVSPRSTNGHGVGSIVLIFNMLCRAEIQGCATASTRITPITSWASTESTFSKRRAAQLLYDLIRLLLHRQLHLQLAPATRVAPRVVQTSAEL